MLSVLRGFQPRHLAHRKPADPSNAAIARLIRCHVCRPVSSPRSTPKSLRECLCLITDLERDLDIHSRIEIQIGEGRWLEPVLIEPEPHVFQSRAKIIIGDPHFSRVQWGRLLHLDPNPLRTSRQERCSRDTYSTLTLGLTPRFGSGGG